MGRWARMSEAFRRTVSRLASAPREERTWWEREPLEPPWPDAKIVEFVVDNRVFLLGLDELYRHAMKKHERGELLAAAQSVTSALHVLPADVPVEGYYSENSDLTTYFRLVRALQSVPLRRAREVESMPQFRRILAVTSSPIFGPPIREYLLPKGNDPLSAALKAAKRIDEWTVPLLTAAASNIARATDDYSLIGLAARVADPVVIAALRESVVLYAKDITLGAGLMTRRQFVWQVDPELCAAAQRFVDAFNTLFGRELPPPKPEYAHAFAGEFDEFQIVGRCVRLGQTTEPNYYHWAVVKGPVGQLEVKEFWAPEIWTTERYREALN